ncbi:maintenance of mitochondrial morphology protein 1 [Lipomyces oligophaga]|uniref:maintenance of mitochondrial morphology protein 1 n=1 Tax=Lipomyces oligophaga TaxID=45792 RepID=UPI0034CDD21B
MAVDSATVVLVTVTETESVFRSIETGNSLVSNELDDIMIDKSESGLTFTHGLLIGQFSVLIILFTFIRYFIFATGPDMSAPAPAPRGLKRQTSVMRSSPPIPARSILARTVYNVDTHPAESLDWLNVLVAQTVSQFREDARLNNNILHTLDKILNGDSLPSFLDQVRVTELDIGEEFPIFSNCKIYPCEDDPGRLEARLDVDLADSITLGIDTRLLLNYPAPMIAILPVSLSVSIVRFTGQLTISFKTIAPTSATDRKTSLTFSFAPNYRLEFAIKSLVGSRSRLQNLPKITQLVESRIRKWFVERCVQPRFQEINLPSMWPRRKNTRESFSTGSR